MYRCHQRNFIRIKKKDVESDRKLNNSGCKNENNITRVLLETYSLLM